MSWLSREARSLQPPGPPVKSTPVRLDELREILSGLTDDDSGVVRTAVRLALAELDAADAAADPTPHYAQITRLIDAVLDPEDGSQPTKEIA